MLINVRVINAEKNKKAETISNIDFFILKTLPSIVRLFGKTPVFKHFMDQF